MPPVLKIILLLFAIPPVLLGVALACMAVPLPAPFPEALSRGRNVFAAVITGLVGLGGLAGLGAYTVSIFRQAGRQLEGPFVELGLKASSAMGVGRRYAGTWRGRSVKVQVMPPTAPEAGRVELEVAGAGLQRLALGGNKPLLDCSDCPRIEDLPAALATLHVRAEAPERARATLARPEVEAALVVLLQGVGPGPGADRELYVQPTRVWLRTHTRPGPSDAAAVTWLGALVDLVVALEASPTPSPE